DCSHRWRREAARLVRPGEAALPAAATSARTASNASPASACPASPPPSSRPIAAHPAAVKARPKAQVAVSPPVWPTPGNRHLHCQLAFAQIVQRGAGAVVVSDRLRKGEKVAITPGCGLGHYYQLQVAQLGFA